MKLVAENPEEQERFLREVVVPIYEAMKADPTRALSHEDMLSAAEEWDREDGLFPGTGHESLKRSA